MTRFITIDGYRFSIEEPFKAGHILSSNEAMALNNHYADCIRNSFRPRLRALHNHEKLHIHSFFKEYIKTYKLQPTHSRDYGDPVEEEARRIAKNQIILNSRKRGVEPEITEEKITKTIESHPAILEEAESRIKLIQDVAETSLGHQ